MIDKLSAKELFLICSGIEIFLLLAILIFVVCGNATVRRLFNESELVRYLKKLGGE